MLKIDPAKNEAKSPLLEKNEKNIEEEKEAISKLENEKLRYFKELEELNLELEKKNKNFLIQEIKNEILVKLVRFCMFMNKIRLNFIE